MRFSASFAIAAVLLAAPKLAGVEASEGGRFAFDVRHARYRLNNSAALVPPKPKEFVSANSIGIARALFGT